MGRILFSISVSEKPDAIRLQVENISYFCPEALIYLHVEAGAAIGQGDLAGIGARDNVVINPHSYEVVPKGGMLHVHVGNFRHAIASGQEFDRIVLFSPHEWLLRHGLAAYLAQHQLGVQTELFENNEDGDGWRYFVPDVRDRPETVKLLAETGLPMMAGGQAEGQFFSKSVFTYLEQIFAKSFPMAPCGFPSEQIVTATVAMRLAVTGTDVVLPISFSDQTSHMELFDEFIDLLVRARGAVYQLGKRKSLRPAHAGSANLGGVFAISCTDPGEYDLDAKIRSLMA